MEAKFARVNMIDFVSKEALEEVQDRYAQIREKTYPGLEFTVNVRTGPQSMMSLLIYGWKQLFWRPQITINSLSPAHLTLLRTFSFMRAASPLWPQRWSQMDLLRLTRNSDSSP